jgi:MerR family transcriptional regulator/heat shock protein HspR
VRDDDPQFVISEAAALAGMHPQTLRQYDRLGLVSPRRASGRGRRYSARDVAKLREVHRLSHDEGINLAGIKKILTLEERVDRLESLLEILAQRADPGRRVFAAGPAGDVVIVPRGRRVERETAQIESRAALVRWTAR